MRTEKEGLNEQLANASSANDTVMKDFEETKIKLQETEDLLAKKTSEFNQMEEQ